MTVDDGSVVGERTSTYPGEPRDLVATVSSGRRAGRPTGILAARRLHSARIIDHRRGGIDPDDRAALEAGACERCRAVRGEMDRLLGACGAAGVAVTAR